MEDTMAIGFALGASLVVGFLVWILMTMFGPKPPKERDDEQYIVTIRRLRKRQRN